jgi:hypothetical protein
MSICSKLKEVHSKISEVYSWALGNPKAWETIRELNPEIWDILLEHSKLKTIIDDLCST